MKLDSELLSLIYLMDDPDPVVKEAIRERVILRGEEAIEGIERYVDSLHGKEEREKYERYLSELKSRLYLDELKPLLLAPEPKLDRGLILITQIADQESSTALYHATLTLLAEELIEELGENKTALEKVEIFNHLFFNRFKFKHKSGKMKEPHEALIDRVMLSRTGNPVVVTLIYFLLADVAGIPIFPLCFPGGFIPVYIDGNGKILFYINVFEKGAIFTEETLKEYFGRMGLPYNKENLSIEESRALLAIYVELLSFVYSGIKAQEVVGRLEEVINLIGGRKYL